MFPPALDYDLRLLERVKDFSIKQFIPELGVEAFAIPVFLWAPRHNVSRLGTDKRNPFPQSLGDKFQAIVGTNMRRNAAQDEEIGEHIDNVDSLQPSLDPDGDTFSREFVNHV